MKAVNSVKELNEVLTQDKPILLDFYADWCGPCRALTPIVEKVAEDYSDNVVVRKVNVDDNREIASHFGVRSIPALFFIKDSEVVDSSVGVVSETQLRQMVEAMA